MDLLKLVIALGMATRSFGLERLPTAKLVLFEQLIHDRHTDTDAGFRS